MITIREEQISDIEPIRVVNTRAFGQAAEADVVDKLRQVCPEGLSLVAVCEDQIVGHILFTPALIEAKGQIIQGMGLAPLAVLPEFQGQGIGSKLVQEGLAAMRKAQQPFVLVLGHPEYYPRFGFVRSVDYGIVSEYDNVPEEAFMILVLDEVRLQEISGIGKYRPEFEAAM
ncbi:MAG: N-acetyltransferase [Anaerolineales bacterium]|nr:N-acetyltransferase [Anaerolineales bacterium]